MTPKELERAFAKAPDIVRNETKDFLVRAIAEVKRVAVQTPPWRVGQRGGGVPVRTGNLRGQHYTRIKEWQASFGVSPQRVRYAVPVHNRRPWLDYARQTAGGKVQSLFAKLGDDILKKI